MEPQAKPGDYYFGHNTPEDIYVLATKDSLAQQGIDLGLKDGELLGYKGRTWALPGTRGELVIMNGELTASDDYRHVNVWNGDPKAKKLEALMKEDLQRPGITYERNGKEEALPETVKNAVLGYAGGR